MKLRLGLWVVLIILFVAFVNFFAHRPEDEPPSGDESAQGQSSGLSQPVPLVLAVVVFVGMFLVLRSVRAMKGHNEGVVLMQQGRTLEAIEKFKQTRDKSRIAVPSLNLGNAYLGLWRVPEAIAALEDFQKRSRGFFGQTPGVAPLATAALALAHALNGNAAQARAEIEKLANKGQTMSGVQLAEVVLACRAQDWQRAKDLLTRNAVKLDELGGQYRALLDVLISWTASHLGGADGQVSAVRLYRETGPEALRQAWPELVAFVERAEAGPSGSPQIDR